MFETFLIAPLYNGFVFLVAATGGNVGVAIIALTLIIRILLYPIFTASIRAQMGMQMVQGELDALKIKYKDKPEEQVAQTRALFKKYNVKPYAGFLALLVQLPVFLALYFAFFREGFPVIKTALLYSFVHAPAVVDTGFFGLINLLLAHNLILSLLVGAAQYAVVRLSLARMDVGQFLPKERATAMRMQQNMMLYVMPALFVAITYSFPAAVGLYFLTTNVFSFVQEYLLKRKK